MEEGFGLAVPPKNNAHLVCCHCRYAYVCHLKNPGFLNDELVHAFLDAMVNLLPGHASLLCRFADVSENYFWHRCAVLP